MKEDIKNLLEMLEYASKHKEFKVTLDGDCCELLHNYINELKRKSLESEEE